MERISPPKKPVISNPTILSAFNTDAKFTIENDQETQNLKVAIQPSKFKQLHEKSKFKHRKEESKEEEEEPDISLVFEERQKAKPQNEIIPSTTRFAIRKLDHDTLISKFKIILAIFILSTIFCAFYVLSYLFSHSIFTSF